jgi:NHLM bacteriocin system ABC transporter ATP-binding protein
VTTPMVPPEHGPHSDGTRAPVKPLLRVVEALEPAMVGSEFRLESDSQVIGRADDCNILLRDSSVSRHHAKIQQTAEGYTIIDTGSANGLWVGERRVSEQNLTSGLRIRVGAVVLEFIAPEPPADDIEKTTFLVLPTMEPAKPAVATESEPEPRAEQAAPSAAPQPAAPPFAPAVQQIEVARDRVAEPPAVRTTPLRLPDLGEVMTISGNQPLLLDDPDSLFLLETGKVEIFTVDIRDGETVGSRTHFVTVEPGGTFFGMDLDRYGMGSGMLAVGKVGTAVRKISIASLGNIVHDEESAAEVGALVDGWVHSLSRRITKEILPGPLIDMMLAAGEELWLEGASKAKSGEGILWVDVAESPVLFIGMSEVVSGGGAALFPVSPDTWIESAAVDVDAIRFGPLATAGAVRLPGFWEGLDLFHQAICECEFFNRKLATADEFNRLRSKAVQSEAAREAAYAEIGAVLDRPTARTKVVIETGDAEPVYQACRLVGEALQLDIRKPVEQREERSFEDQLADVAIASRFRTRMVMFRGAWWKLDHGALLARSEETGDAIALLPTGANSYEYVNSRSGGRGPVDGNFASTLAPFAWAFYRPLPGGEVGVKHLIRFGAMGLSKDFMTVAAMGLVTGLLGSLTPFFTGRIFDTAIPTANSNLLTQYALALFVAAITGSAFKITQSIAVLRVQGKMDYSIQAALWDRLLDLPSTFFKKFSAGDLADRASGVNAIRGLVAGAGVSAVLGSVSSLFYVAMMLMYSVPLALLSILLTLIFISFTFTANYMQLRHQREEIKLRGKITGLVLQLITGVSKLRVAGAEHHAFKVWAKEFADQRRISFRVGRIQNSVVVFNSAFPIYSSMAIFAVLVYVQQSASASGAAPTLTTGDFIAFNAAFGLFLGAMQALSDASLNLLKAVPIYERLKPILTTAPEVDEGKAYPGQLKGEIELSHLFFRYSADAAYVVKDFSLKIKPGEFVAFVGGSGCGKSTLMRLMLGFELPEKGSIYFDGQDLSTLDLRLVRQQLGVVLQDSRVLPADIFRNIVGTSSRTIEEAWEAAEAAGLAEDVRQMPMQMHTYVSEGGGGFSGGQKQRLLIARALVNKPKIIFMDEATSALDNRTQAIVTQSLDRLRATRIVIAHRLSTIQNAERICYLEGGEIKEMGNFQELMAKNGLFAELARRQMA